MIEITLLGTGSPIPDPNRAGPSTLVRAGGQVFLVDCGRGVLQRAAAIGVGPNALSALLLTHLHSDHIAELGDVLITRWVTTFVPDPAPLPIIGPPGTAEVVAATLKAFGHDICYRIAHHADLTAPPSVEVREYTEGSGVGPRRRRDPGGAHRSSAGIADHRVQNRVWLRRRQSLSGAGR